MSKPFRGSGTASRAARTIGRARALQAAGVLAGMQGDAVAAGPMLEESHASHTDQEMRDAFAKAGFSPQSFLRAGEAMLDGVAGFWDGLEAARLGGQRMSTA